MWLTIFCKIFFTFNLSVRNILLNFVLNLNNVMSILAYHKNKSEGWCMDKCDVRRLGKWQSMFTLICAIMSPRGWLTRLHTILDIYKCSNRLCDWFVFLSLLLLYGLWYDFDLIIVILCGSRINQFMGSNLLLISML